MRGTPPSAPWDAGFIGSFAWAGGAPWEPESSAERRREFWHWYLREAAMEAGEKYGDEPENGAGTGQVGQ